MRIRKTDRPVLVALLSGPTQLDEATSYRLRRFLHTQRLVVDVCKGGRQVRTKVRYESTLSRHGHRVALQLARLLSQQLAA